MDGKSFTKDIEVNDPLTYKGITFYQSSYEAYQDFVISITNIRNRNRKTFVVPFQKQVTWPEEGLKFGVINAKAMGKSIVSSKIWFSDGNGSPTVKWVDNGAEITVKGGNTRIICISAKQMYSTGLQVAKDPGVWWVYIGCGLDAFRALCSPFSCPTEEFGCSIKDSGAMAHRFCLRGRPTRTGPDFESTFVELNGSNLQSTLDSTARNLNPFWYDVYEQQTPLSNGASAWIVHSFSE